jgi:hypothetical protein
MSPETFVAAGGLFSAAIAIFHLTFWKLFRWKSELARLGPLNRAVVQVLNLALTFLFVALAWVSLVHRQELVATALGQSLLGWIAAFWWLRAVAQLVFFGWKPLSVAFFALCLAGGSLYLAPLVLR